MSLSIGIVGLPNVGKSTLFNALTKNNILMANYPFATIEPNTGIVPIPDSRLEKLSEIYNNAPIKPATVTFVDIAGLVAGASKGEGLGNQFLANVRNCQAICHVVRAFDDGNVVHVANRVHPKEDIEIINTELMLADLQTLEKVLPKKQKEAKANPKIKEEIEELESIKNSLESGKLPNHTKKLSDISSQLLSTKPVIYMFNISESDLGNKAKKQELSKLVETSESIFVSAKVEQELQGLDEHEAKELLEDLDQKESGLVQLIHASYKTLGLQSYLTAGVKEVRAWTIKKGSTAPQAAGVIHGDFEKGFIAAEVVDYDDLIKYGSRAEAKNAGKVRTEGKAYVMQPNDVVEFRFNV